EKERARGIDRGERRIEREQREQIGARVDRGERVGMTDAVCCTEDQGANVQRAVQRDEGKLLGLDSRWRARRYGWALKNSPDPRAELVQNGRPRRRLETRQLRAKGHTRRYMRSGPQTIISRSRRGSIRAVPRQSPSR